LLVGCGYNTLLLENSASYDISNAMENVGTTYLTMFENNQGMSGKDKPGFLFSMGLKAEAPQNYTVDGWEEQLRKHDPLWVTTTEVSGSLVHARILKGIAGDGTPNGTNLTIVDPGDGKVHTETVVRIELGALRLTLPSRLALSGFPRPARPDDRRRDADPKPIGHS
jgi:hypothetical protein